MSSGSRSKSKREVFDFDFSIFEKWTASAKMFNRTHGSASGSTEEPLLQRLRLGLPDAVLGFNRLTSLVLLIQYALYRFFEFRIKAMEWYTKSFTEHRDPKNFPHIQMVPKTIKNIILNFLLGCHILKFQYILVSKCEFESASFHWEIWRRNANDSW